MLPSAYYVILNVLYHCCYRNYIPDVSNMRMDMYNIMYVCVKVYSRSRGVDQWNAVALNDLIVMSAVN